MKKQKETIEEYDERKKGEFFIVIGAFLFWLFGVWLCGLLEIGL